MSDYILTILIIAIVISFTFKTRLKKTLSKSNLILLFLILLILLEWFNKHPSLRYGGYFPVALFLFFLFSCFVDYTKLNLNFNKSRNRKKILILLFVPIFFFNVKNIHRIYGEFNRSDIYKYTEFPFQHIPKKDYRTLTSIDGKNYLYLTNGWCWATPTPCGGGDLKHRIIYGYKFFYIKQ